MLMHHPDGYIILNGAFIQIADFITCVPAYALPEHAIGRCYDPGRDHYLMLPDGSVGPLSLQWPEGNRLIAQADAIRQSQARRKHAAATPILDRTDSSLSPVAAFAAWPI